MHLFFHFLCEFLRDPFNQIRALFYLISFPSQKVQLIYVSWWKDRRTSMWSFKNNYFVTVTESTALVINQIVDELHTQSIPSNWKNNQDKSIPACVIEKEITFPFTCRVFLEAKGCPVTAFNQYQIYKNCYGEFLNIIKDILIIATPRSEFTKNRGFLKKKSFEYLK